MGRQFKDVASPQVDRAFFIEYLRSQGVSLRQLAQRIGTNPTTLSRTFSGQRDADESEAQAIASALSLSEELVSEKLGLGAMHEDSVSVGINSVADSFGEISPIYSSPNLSPDTLKLLTEYRAIYGNDICVGAYNKNHDSSPLDFLHNFVFLYKEPKFIDFRSISQLAVVSFDSNPFTEHSKINDRKKLVILPLLQGPRIVFVHGLSAIGNADIDLYAPEALQAERRGVYRIRGVAPLLGTIRA